LKIEKKIQELQEDLSLTTLNGGILEFFLKFLTHIQKATQGVYIGT